MSILHKLQWRYAVKEFDQEQTVSEKNITELLEATNLAPTAFGLQPFDIIVISNKEIQKELVEYSYGQEKILDASHVIVFAAHKKISDFYIKEYVARTAEIRNIPVGSLFEFESMMLNTFHALPEDKHVSWSQRQLYLALGVLLTAAADLKIDSCPMEGFIPEKYNEILDLPEHLQASVVVPLGYRSDKDDYQHRKKVRRDLVDIVTLEYKKTEV